VGKPEGKRPIERPRIRWKEWILGRLARGGGVAVGPSGSGYGPVAGSHEHSDGHSGSGVTELFYVPFYC
jgi:hypothetical protein